MLDSVWRIWLLLPKELVCLSLDFDVPSEECFLAPSRLNVCICGVQNLHLQFLPLLWSIEGQHISTTGVNGASLFASFCSEVLRAWTWKPPVSWLRLLLSETDFWSDLTSKSTFEELGPGCPICF